MKAVPLSGKFHLRMPATLHTELSAAAAREGVSLNQLLVALLAGAISFDLEE